MSTPQEATPGVRPAVATAGKPCPRCGEPIPPGRPGYPRDRLFCSDACRTQFWDAKHPRQKPLDFEPPTEPALVLNPTAPKERKLKMQRAGYLILDRLVQGPATTAELMALIGSPCYGRRVDELRRYLRVLCGYNAGEKSTNPILCLRPSSSNPTWMLADWAEPEARTANRRRREAASSSTSQLHT